MPLGYAILEPSRCNATLAKRRDCLQRKNAVRTTTIRDNRASLGHSLCECSNLLDWYRRGPGDVCRVILVERPHIDQRGSSCLQTTNQLVAADRLEVVATDHVITYDRIELREPSLGRAPQCVPEHRHGIISNAVQDALALTRASTSRAAASSCRCC